MRVDPAMTRTTATKAPASSRPDSLASAGIARARGKWKLFATLVTPALGPLATDWSEVRLPIPRMWFVVGGLAIVVVLTAILLLSRPSAKTAAEWRRDEAPRPAPFARRRSRVQTIHPRDGAVVAYRASVTGEAGAAIEVMLGDPRVPAVSIFLNERAQNLTLEVERWLGTKSPPATAALPFNHLASCFLRVSLGPRVRAAHVVMLDLDLVEEDAVYPERLSILEFREGLWVPVVDVPLSLEPSGRYHGQAAVPTDRTLAVAFNLSTLPDPNSFQITPTLRASP
jgi:hypothetical protein